MDNTNHSNPEPVNPPLEELNKSPMLRDESALLPSQGPNPPVLDTSLDPNPVGVLASQEEPDYNHSVVQAMTTMANSIQDLSKNLLVLNKITLANNMASHDMETEIRAVKECLAGIGLMNLDKNHTEGLSDTQILPDEGDDSMARLRGRLKIGDKYQTISASTAQDLINKTKLLTELMAEAQPEAQPNAIPLFRDYGPYFLETFSRPKVAPTTYAGYKCSLKKLVDAFGDLRLDQINKEAVQKFINSLKNNKSKTVKNHIKLLSLILQCAVDDELIKKDVTKNKSISFPQAGPTIRNALSEDDYYDIMNQLLELQPKDRLLLALLLFTGARRGEVLALRPMDIDREKGLVSIRRQVRITPDYKSAVVNGTKMNKEGREVPLLHQLVEVLDQLDPSWSDGKGEFLLFGDGEKPLTGQQFKNTWTRIEKKINLHGATPHVLRHTFLTYANNHGVDPVSLKTIAGHSSVAFTLAQYVHSQEKQIKEAGELISSNLKKE